MADEEQTPAEDTPAEAGVEQRVDSLESKVDKILGILSGQAGSAENAGDQDQPTNIAHEIRAQLDAQERKRAADAAEQAKDGRLAAVEASVAELSEKPPEPMPRRVERIMGWR